MHLRTAAAVTSAALMLLAACGGDDSSKASGKSTTSSTRATTTSSTVAGTDASCGAADPAELESFVKVSVPAGFEAQPDDVGDTGPSDFNKAVSDDGEADAATALRAAGFRRGYQRLWVNNDDSELIAFVYEFCTAAGADAYAARGAQSYADATTFSVNGVTPDANGFAGSDDQGAVYAEVQASPGKYVVMADADGPGATVSPAVVQQLATGLAANLVASVGAPTT